MLINIYMQLHTIIGLLFRGLSNYGSAKLCNLWKIDVEWSWCANVMKYLQRIASVWKMLRQIVYMQGGCASLRVKLWKLVENSWKSSCVPPRWAAVCRFTETDLWYPQHCIHFFEKLRKQKNSAICDKFFNKFEDRPRLIYNVDAFSLTNFYQKDEFHFLQIWNNIII